jgi:hypothetical protein
MRRLTSRNASRSPRSSRLIIVLGIVRSSNVSYHADVRVASIWDLVKDGKLDCAEGLCTGTGICRFGSVLVSSG